MITINVAKEFTDAPGARYRCEGDFSGEEFREDFLEPRFFQAVNEGKKLFIDLDGGYGYATSFLEETFGGLARKYKDKDKILSTIVLKSDDEPGLIDDIIEYVKKADEK